MKTTIEPRTALDRAAIVVATAGGAGFFPKAPGTAGAAVGVFIYLAIESLGAGAYYLHVIILLLAAGTWASGRVERFYGHDSGRIVIDEVAGQMIAFAAAAGRFQLSTLHIAIGFALFRLFDILKPFPARRLERLEGGLGVMADDVAAGLYALGALTLIQYGFGG